MANNIDEGLAPPDHPIYKEGPRSYSPHWARGLTPSTSNSPKNTAGPTDPNAAARLDLDALAEGWGAVKLAPSQTGLPMAVWIMENSGNTHGVRVKVSPVHGGRGSWRGAVSIDALPTPHEIVPGSLPLADVALVRQWIELNRNAIVQFWDGAIDVPEVLARLQAL